MVLQNGGLFLGGLSILDFRWIGGKPPSFRAKMAFRRARWGRHFLQFFRWVLLDLLETEAKTIHGPPLRLQLLLGAKVPLMDRKNVQPEGLKQLPVWPRKYRINFRGWIFTICLECILEEHICLRRKKFSES